MFGKKQTENKKQTQKRTTVNSECIMKCAFLFVLIKAVQDISQESWQGFVLFCF